MNQIRIFICDDHPFIRDGIRSLLGRIPEAKIIGEAGDGIEACRLVQEQEPDLLLLDIQMPIMDGWEVVRILRANGNNTYILLISASDYYIAIHEILALGGISYMTKDEVPVKLASVIREIFL